MRAADLTTAVVLMAGGALVIWDSLRLGIGWGTDGPRSGFFPFWLAVILIGCCLGIMAQALIRASRKPFMERAALRPVLKMLLPSAGFVLATQFVGLYVATALYMGLYMRWIGRYSWLVTVAVSVAFPVVTFLVFEKWFLVPMPKGPFETWLGY
ncbi:MAG TPA: tripartite tricarboxylate transporter TctB family protein [Methylomirabilota bacterium]|nr:tripartite tricarboxylate transporter TctB family protein [Methylomirabilota bacterium]